MDPQSPSQTPLPTEAAAQVQAPPAITTKAPMSKLGLWSFILAIGVVPALYIGSVFISIIIGALTFDAHSTEKALGSFMTPVYGILIATNINLFVLLTATGLGIASIFSKNKRNVLGIIGLCLSVMGLLVTFVIPKLVGSIFS